MLLGRAGERVGRLYFADLVGAGLGCLVAIPLITRLGPPRVIALAALVFVVGRDCSLTVGARSSSRSGASLAARARARGRRLRRRAARRAGRGHEARRSRRAMFSEWGPVFRVDVVQFVPDQPNRLLVHDGTFGRASGGGTATSTLTPLRHRTRARSRSVLGDAPEHELIIGSAGGKEILASLHFDAPHIEAVELNPVTVWLLTDTSPTTPATSPTDPRSTSHHGDGRSYLARSDGSYDLVWYVAPDSYAATNAASSGAFVLSESYLYTKEMIRETLEHLTDDGIMVVQFGELDFDGFAEPDQPLHRHRTRRARAAGRRRPVHDISSSPPSSPTIAATSRRSS